MVGVLAGLIVGFSLATALFRGFVRRLEERYQADADRPAAPAAPVAVPPRDTAPTRRPRGATARTARAPRRHPAAVTTASPAPAPAEPMLDIPVWMVEQLMDHLARLDVLERRDAMRVVRRTIRP
jgi:hypothetical protein